MRPRQFSLESYKRATGIALLLVLASLALILLLPSSIRFIAAPLLSAIAMVFGVFIAINDQKKCLEPMINDYEEALASLKQSDISSVQNRAASDNSLSMSVQSLLGHTREAKKQERALVDNAVDVICVIDINASILQVNAASKAVWGYSPDELMARNLADFIVREDLDDTLNNILGAEKSIDRIFFENRFLKKNGESADMLWSAHWSITAGGLFCVAHDITDRKKIERQLKESEERLRELFQHLPTGVVVVNGAGMIEFMNETGCLLSGYKANRVYGMNSCDILGFCQQQPFLSKRLDDLIDSNETSFPSQVMKEDGQRFPAEISLSRLLISGERCYLVCFSDVSEKHAIEMAKREFVSMVSHDLRTPLTSILSTMSYLDAGHGGSLSATGASLANRGKKECERLIGLINDLLNLEKMKSGKFNMHFAKIGVKELIGSAIEAAEQYAKMHDVKIEAIVFDDLFAFGDGARIIQVLINLLDNAIKFSPAGGTVAVFANQTGDLVEIRISNKGRLIPAEKLSTIFERFEQVDESDSRERKGSGLGLAICKTIIDQHQGRIWVSSTEQDGTSFSFSLKAKGPEIEPLEPERDLL